MLESHVPAQRMQPWVGDWKIVSVILHVTPRTRTLDAGFHKSWTVVEIK